MITKTIFAVITSLLLVGCATMRSQETMEASDSREPAASNDANFREPASMVGNEEWLNQVQDDFSRIADETSSRTIASKKPNTLVERNRWAFLYFPINNQFSLKLDGKNFGMIQTNLDDSDMFAFAAEGQTETPITLTFARKAGREVAEANEACSAELSFWDVKNKKYEKDIASIHGERCAKVIAQLRSYVP